MAKRTHSLSCRLARSRRALATLLLLGGAAMTSLASPAAAHDHAVTDIDLLSVMAERLPQPTKAAVPIDDWMLDKWLAWGTGSKQWISPLLPTATPALTPSDEAVAVPRASDRSLARELSDLTCEEPVDVHRDTGQAIEIGSGADLASDVAALEPGAVDSAPQAEPQLAVESVESSAPSDPPATAPPKYGSLALAGNLALVGNSPIIATLPDTYLAYDLSPEDAIAMRMYPIDQPSPNYSAARRTSIYGAVVALDSSSWRILSEPAVIVSTAELARKVAPPVAPSLEPVAPVELTEADERFAALASHVIQAVQPESELRSWLRPGQLGNLLGQWSGRSSALADELLANLRPAAAENAESISGMEAAAQLAQAELQAPRQPQAQAAPLLPIGEGRVLQVELACQTAIEVVMAQAARSAAVEPAPSLAEAPSDPITRALAVATACDHAAASLEKLAMAIRRAGDSWVRQAQIESGNSTMLR